MIKSTITTINDKTRITALENKNQTKIIFCNKGAAIFRIFFSDQTGKIENIVMAPADLNDWLENRTFSGAIVGPLAGRYGSGAAEAGLELNRPPLHFHGGTSGLDTVYWEEEINEKENNVTLTYRYFDRKTLTAFKVSYTFTDEDRLTMEVEAAAQKDTFVNPTNHIYFNLNGDPFKTITNHQLQLNSNCLYTENKEQLITDSQVILPDGNYDFSKERSLAVIEKINGLNTTFILADNKSGTIYQPENGRRVTIATTLPAVVIYSFNTPQEVFHAEEKTYPEYAGITFETQYPANDLTTVKLAKGQHYYSRTAFHFTIDK